VLADGAQPAQGCGNDKLIHRSPLNMSTPPTGVLSDLDRVLLDSQQIQARVAAMAESIARDHGDQVLTVVALMDGALFFVADLLRHLDLPIRIVTMGASSYSGGVRSSGKVQLNWPQNAAIRGARVLLIDDILDTGLTIGAVQDRLAEEGAAEVKTAILLKKRRHHDRDVTVDYVGFEIEDEFVVGYGMDYQGRFRNLPCIGILKL
jgi:hypoxanthine phosphoribosyltransferase